MRINSKLLLLLVMLFLLYVLFFSSSSEDTVVNYKGLLPEIKIREFLKANYYFGAWNRLDNNSDVLEQFDGHFKFIVAGNRQDADNYFLDEVEQMADGTKLT